MPLELQIIRASEFLRMGPNNLLDFHESKNALTLLAKACQKRGIGRALVDLRPLPIPEKPLFTPTQIAELVDAFRQAGFTEHHRLAILYRSDPHHGTRMFAFISTLRGGQVKAFKDFEEAVHWLSEDQKTAEAGDSVEVVSPESVNRLKVAKGTTGQGD